MGRKAVSTLFKEWKKAEEAATKAAFVLDQRYKRREMKSSEVQLLVEFWLSTKNNHRRVAKVARVADAIFSYPQFIDYQKITNSSYFEAIVKGVNYWPDEALPALKRYLTAKSNPDVDVVRRILNRLSKCEDFEPDAYSELIRKYGSATLVKRLLDQKSKDYIEFHADNLLRPLLQRFAKDKPDYEGNHPLCIIARAKNLPTIFVTKIVQFLLANNWFYPACKLVREDERYDLIPLLEEVVLESRDLHKIRIFLRDFPRANKDRFRGVVRKLLVPDPNDLTDAFLEGRYPMMHPYYHF